MPAESSPGEGDFLDDIETWMARRKAQVGQFAQDAQAAGRQAWDDATRNGRDLLARTQGELTALGRQRLAQMQGGAPAQSNTAGSAPSSWLDRSSVAKVLGGSLAETAGTVAGLGQGVWHSVEGLGQGVLFATHLFDPYDAEENGADHAAWGQLVHDGAGVLGYVKNGIANPAGVVTDFKNLGRRLDVETNPTATPAADTFGGEMSRNFGLERNQGELDWDIGSSLFGGASTKVLRGLGSVPEAEGAAKFLAQGFSPAQADYLATPYKGMGQHFVPRSVAKAIGAPKPLTDSPFNVLKPTGMNRGDFYELHYSVDPNFYGARLPRKAGGGAWKGKSLDLQKYGLLGRLWHGSPAPLNAAAGVAGATGSANYKPDGDAAQ